MSQKRLEEASRVLYRALNALSKAEMAPDSWKKASSDAYDYVHSELGHLIEFRLCSNNWKGERWVTKRYSSWSGRPLTDKKRSMSQSMSVIPKEEHAIIDGNFKVPVPPVCFFFF